MLHKPDSLTARTNQPTRHNPENWWLQGSAKKLPLEGYSHYLGRRLNLAPIFGDVISKVADEVGGTTNTVMSLVCRTEQLQLHQLLGEKGLAGNGTTHLCRVFDALIRPGDTSFEQPTTILVTGIDIHEPDQSVNGHARMRTPTTEHAVGSPYHTRTYLAARVIVGAAHGPDSSLMVPFGWIQVPNSKSEDVTNAINNVSQDGLPTYNTNSKTLGGLVVDASPLCIVAEPTGTQRSQNKCLFRPA